MGQRAGTRAVGALFPAFSWAVFPSVHPPQVKPMLALAPICADKFQRGADAAANLTELMKVNSWQQGSFVEKGGWATLPGSDPANSAVAQACANLITRPK